MAFKPELILVVDDSEDEVFIMLRAFRDAQLVNPVFVLHDGDEAVAYLEGTGKFSNRDEYPLPSIILLDLKMPNRNGFEVLEWIRRHPQLKTLRVVVLTNSGNIADVTKAYRLGANSFIVKPAHSKQFANMVEAIKGYWIFSSKAPHVERPAREHKILDEKS